MHEEIMAITFVCIERFFDDSSNFLSPPSYLHPEPRKLLPKMEQTQLTSSIG
jgi:hypothetical protein